MFALAQWICLCFPSCCPGFESQVHHLRFYQFKFEFKLWHVEKTKINRKEAGIGPFQKIFLHWPHGGYNSFIGAFHPLTPVAPGSNHKHSHILSTCKISTIHRTISFRPIKNRNDTVWPRNFAGVYTKQFFIILCTLLRVVDLWKKKIENKRKENIGLYFIICLPPPWPLVIWI